jgi:hypothetical protein
MKKLPVCFGQYEADHPACNGVRLKTVPCAVRDRCLALRLHCRKVGQRRQDFLHYEKVGKEEYAHPLEAKLIPALDRIIVQQGIRDGRVTGPTKVRRKKRKVSKAPRPPRTTTAKRAARRGAKERAEADAKVAMSLVGAFVGRLAEQSERRLAQTPGSADIGDLFLDYKVRYVTVYARIEDYKQKPVAVVYPKSRRRLLSILVAADYFDIEKLLSVGDKQRLTLENITGKGGSFNVRFVDLDRAHAARVAERIASAINAGIIALPDSSA